MELRELSLAKASILSARSFFTASGICSDICAAACRAGGKGKTCIRANCIFLQKSKVSLNSVSVSPGKPTITSVVTAAPGMAARKRSTARR